MKSNRTDKNDLVSIVIPQYNGVQMLRDCIASLYKAADFFYGEYPLCRTELIIVDNASTDGTKDFLDTLPENPNASLPVRVIRNEENLGFAKAVNQGIQSATGEYVLLLNNDTVAERELICALKDCMDKEERIFSASSMMRMYHEPDLVDDAGDIYCLMGWALQRGHAGPVSKYQKPCGIFSACGGAAMYRRKVFEEIGYFDERFFAYMEDVDLGYRSLLHGYRNVYCPTAQVYHIGSASSGGPISAFKVHLSSRNSIYVMYKNMPMLLLILHFPFLLLGFSVKYLYFTRDGYRKAFEQGYREAFATLSQVEKVRFRPAHLLHYLYVEWLLFINTFKAFFWKGQRMFAKIRRSLSKSQT